MESAYELYVRGTELLFGIAKLERTGNGRWWLAVGSAVGMALLSKYTGFFLAAGAGLWCLASRQGRRWLRTAWPYAAIAVAALCFLPALLWNAAHNWISFRFQFGRVAGGSLSSSRLNSSTRRCSSNVQEATSDACAFTVIAESPSTDATSRKCAR